MKSIGLREENERTRRNGAPKRVNVAEKKEGRKDDKDSSIVDAIIHHPSSTIHQRFFTLTSIIPSLSFTCNTLFCSALPKMSAPEIEIFSTATVTPQGGLLHRCKHKSESTKTDMIFAIFLPSAYQATTTTDAAAAVTANFPAVYWLSGLTCTDENFCKKAGEQAFAAAEEHGICLVVPDTSPRGDVIPSDDAYDLGTGAGFYINATNSPWDTNYHMESYISVELPALVETKWGVGTANVRSICGHSMGGHGAITLALKADKGSWASVSAFAPICHPTACPWGIKAFENYFGSVDAGKDHDATLLLQLPGKASTFDDILIDEGTDDEFGKAGQLLLKDFEDAAAKVGQKLTVRRQEGYDHSYNFISTFIAEHIAYHAKKLHALVARKA
jgi:S-formylglutathione hydrolase